MILLEQLIEVLQKYIDKTNDLKKEYENKNTILSLYKELIKELSNKKIITILTHEQLINTLPFDDLINNLSYEDLTNALIVSDWKKMKTFISVLIDTIYDDDSYLEEFYKISDQESFDMYVKKIMVDYQVLNIDINDLDTLIKRIIPAYYAALRVIKNIRNGTIISSRDINYIKNIIIQSESISQKEKILLINEIELYNRSLTLENGSEEERKYFESLYNEIPNILNIGFFQLNDVEISADRKNTLDNIVKIIIKSFENLDNSEIISIIENYQIYMKDDNEYNYVLTKLLDYCVLDELLPLYELLLEPGTYKKRSLRLDAVREYYKVLNRYIVIMNYYNKINTPQNEDQTLEEENPSSEIKYVFSHSDTSNKSAKIIGDMKNVPYEYYEDVLDMLSRFKSGITNEYEPLINNGNIRGFYKLKRDQVRIVLKHIGNSVYTIQGVFVKKDNNDMPMYNKMCGRLIPDISSKKKLSYELALGIEVEKELEKLVKGKGRRGNR